MTAVLRPRSVDAVTTGEQVRIHEGPYTTRVGEFMGVTGFVNPRWVVAVPSWRDAAHIFHVPIDSDDFYVTDGGGRVIRRDATPDTFPAGY